MFISDEVTRGLDFVYTYIDDDLLIASANAAEHEHHLRQHFERFQQYGVVINPAKSVFGVATIQFLGHSHPGHGIQPVESKVQAISDFPLPPTLFLPSFYSLMFPYRPTTHRYARLHLPSNEDAELQKTSNLQTRFGTFFQELGTFLVQKTVKDQNNKSKSLL